MRLKRTPIVVFVAVLMMIPLAASASHVSEEDLIDAFRHGTDEGPLEPHGRILPWRTEGDPNLRCVGDPVGTWVGWEKSYDPNSGQSRAEAMQLLNSLEQSYDLDTYGDGDPVALKMKRSGVTWGEDSAWYRQGVPVIDPVLLPEGRHVLHWSWTDGEFPGDHLFAVPIWMADCDQTGDPASPGDDIAVEISTIDVSGYYNVIHYVEPGGTLTLIGVDGSGETALLEDVGVGTPLVFKIDVWECDEGFSYPNEDHCVRVGEHFSSELHNIDNQRYALFIPDGAKTWVFFNDNDIDPNGGGLPFEPNYIDAIFTVEASPS